MTMNQEAVVLMLVFGAAWGFVRLLGDAIIGAFNLSVWAHRKLVERNHD
ncbi:hypothetical protein [Brevundimonas aurantiaca]|nr:hypothetical protein [Brevundimonas aurantiaca]MCC4295804.1 hypothetical protein [Brevundimonas aurantiaca]